MYYIVVLLEVRVRQHLHRRHQREQEFDWLETVITRGHNDQ
jgi:hypothetical protein